MVGSLAFTFSSFNLLHFVHPNAVAAVAHIPWLLAMIDIVMVDANRWKVALAQAFLALLTGSQILLGCPQYVCFSLLTETGFTLWLVMTRKYLPRDGCETMPTCRACIGCRWNSSSRVIVAKAIGLLVGAVQLLPTLEALSQSAPSGGDVPEGATLHPVNLIQLVAPYLPVERAFGGNAHELSLYVGAVPLMLALWALVRRSDLGPMKRLAQVTAGFGRRGIAVGLGQPGPIYRFAALDPLGRMVPVLLPLYGLVPVRHGRAGGHRLRARRARGPGKSRRSSGTCPYWTGEAGLPPCGGSSRSWARPS